ncbi:MAG: hypothetical protein BWK73_45960 [Thiothrix lacustris]|uniref:Uncharacterized protein n=1 Tax=Thiothrix lacustris TaxID=525917 RepID=A0A1Y1QAY3_9GAMM|nr:MAG: hypothetical protein BWK73_45960 [Thiothrix lacustris]
MITRFYIDNFKSLVDFDLKLANFTCLIGLNGAGKSTVLQALDFASALISGDVNTWLSKRNWNTKDLNSKLVNRSNIKVQVYVKINDQLYGWSVVFNRNKLVCTREVIARFDKNSLKNRRDLFLVKDGRYTLASGHSVPIDFQYQGSILSQLKSKLLGDEIHAVKKCIEDIRSLDLLSPQSLRLRARKSDKGDIGMGGEQLSAFVHQLSEDQRIQLVQQLRSYYPQVLDIKTRALRSGWIQLELIEEYSDIDFDTQELKTEARHINDGMLRLLAILAQQFSPLETLLFDEIENGINPEVTEKVVDALVSSPKQIIVTTHSPMILNYMSDEVAKESVNLIYKGENGQTHAARFFEIPSVAKKLESLPPGSAMLDVYLQDAAREAEEQRQTKSQDK